MSLGFVRTTALWLLLSILPVEAQFTVTPLGSFGNTGWLAPNGYNGSTYAYLTTGDTERGLAYGDEHLYLVSRSSGDNIRILDAQTGNDLGSLNLGSGIVSGGTFNVDMVAVGGDGAIYVGNLTLGSTPFQLYRWADDLPATTPTLVYSGLPLAGARLGDTLAVSGGGSATRLVAGFGNNPSVAGNNGYAIIDPTAGTALAADFAGTPPAAGDFRLGISFTDSSHVIGTQGGTGGRLCYTAFSGSTGTLLANPALSATDERPMSFAMVGTFPLLATLNTVNSQVNLYDMADPTQPILVAQATATVGTVPANPRNTGAVAWGKIGTNSATLYALSTAGGIQAFTVTVPLPQPPVISRQPQDQTVNELTPAPFQISATGNRPLSYQWVQNGVPIPGATDGSYTLQLAPLSANQAHFQAVVANTIGGVVYYATSQVAVLTVLADTNAPTVARWIPAAGTVLPSLGEIEVQFSEGVAGVRASDLLVNGVPATNVTTYGPDDYVFDFALASAGPVQVTWNPANAITDLASASNHFAGGDCSYTVNPATIVSSVRLNEFMAANKSTIRDEDGHYSDWLELYNAGDDAVNLGGWYLTDSATNLTKWRFPQGVTLSSRAYLVVWASGNNRTNPLAPLHTNFKLSTAPASYLGLVYPDGATVISALSSYPQQYDDVSYGRDWLDPSIVGFFTNATPGAANATLGAGFAPAVLFSPASRTFQQPLTLTLSLAGSNAVIHYLLVTNAATAAVTNIPTLSSPVYTGPLTISGSCQIRARAFPIQANYFPGPPHNETFLQLSAGVMNVNSDLPLVIFHDLGGGPVAATDRQFMTMQVFDTTYGRSALTNAPDLAVQGYFHRRGQATFGNPKPNLRVETEDEFGDNLDVPLAGLPAENDWVFYGIDQYDKVLMHNPLAHELYWEMGHYTSRTRFVEVYLKVDSGTAGPVTASDYYGLYVIEEKIKLGKHRVDAEKLQPENTNGPSLSGTYLLSIDKSNPGAPAYMANASIWYLDPDYYEITAPGRTAQIQYINSYFNSFYTALTGWTWTNPVSGYAPYIDLDSWIDYHLHQTFVFNVDALRISAYFYKPRSGPIVQGPLWDFDRAFGTRTGDDGRGFNPRRWRSGEADGGTDMFNAGNTFGNPWYGRLFTDPDFFQRWIDRYQELRRSVYSLTNLMSRISYFGDQVRAATSREYARWRGSGASDTSPRSGAVSADGAAYLFPSPGTWQGELNFTKWWFSNRVDFMDTNFLNPPVLSASGGPISPGFVLTINAGTRENGSVILYTLDGTDPRLPGGAIHPAAISNVNNATLTLAGNAMVFARNWNPYHRNLTGPGNPPLSSPWSGPTTATFFTSTPPLRLVELMYHPPPPPVGSVFTNDDFAYITFQNPSGTDINLQGYHLDGVVEFTFGNYVLRAGKEVVLVSNRAAFQWRYPGVTNIAGVYTNNLSHAGGRLVLTGPMHEPILDFAYSDNWYPATDGLGFSLVALDPAADPSAWGLPTNWRPSSVINGSPGTADPAPPTLPPIRVNEALTHHTGLGQKDTIELFNPTTNPVGLGGWFLTNDRHQPKKYRIPDGVTNAPGGFLLFNNDLFGFKLSATGDAFYLFSGDANTNLTGYAHGFNFGAAPNGVTFGRYTDSQGREQFVLQDVNSLGASNAYPRVGPVVISEVMYHPPDLAYGWADTLSQYIELLNITSTNVPLYDPAAPTNTWQLAKGVNFSFPAGVMLPPGGRVLVLAFDPAKFPTTWAAFQAKYGALVGEPAYGPWLGSLATSNATIELQCPDTPKVTSTGVEVPYYTIEALAFDHAAPWPVAADGAGAALQRLQAQLFGNDPSNWQAVAPFSGHPTAPRISLQPTNVTVLAGATAVFATTASGSAPLACQWFFNGTNLLATATNTVLTLTNAQPADAGRYQLVVTNLLGAATSQVAVLNVGLPPQILAQAGDQAVVPGANVMFWVATAGTPPLSYIWYYNTNTFMGAGGTNLLLLSVRASQMGTYHVVISNIWGAVSSRFATLKVLDAPRVSPANLSVVPGAVSMSVGSVPGVNYQLEYKDALTDPVWQPLWPVVPGTGTTIWLQDANGPTFLNRFYRVSCF